MVYIIDTQSDLENYNKTVDLTSDSLLNCRLYYNIYVYMEAITVETFFVNTIFNLVNSKRKRDEIFEKNLEQ